MEVIDLGRFSDEQKSDFIEVLAQQILHGRCNENMRIEVTMEIDVN